MHVLVILTYGVSFKDWAQSGLLDREILLYKKLQKEKKIRFTFVSFGDDEDTELIKNFEVIPFYKYNSLDNGKLKNLFNSLIFPFKIKKLIDKPDLIKTNQLMGSWIGIILKLIFAKPLIVRTGYDLFRFSIYEQKSLIKKILYYILTQFSILFSDLYLVTSKTNKDFLKRYFIKSNKKIMILPNWVETNYEPEELKINLRHKDRIISVGRLVAQKNFSFLINTFKNLEIGIDIVGTGPEKNHLIELANMNDTEVVFLGQYSNKELLKIYKKYNIFISSSLYEGNSKSILEAMASGCVVIAKDNENNREIIKDRKNGFLFSNKQELLDSYNQLRNNSQILSAMSKSAVNDVKKYNSLSEIANKEFELYKKVYKG